MSLLILSFIAGVLTVAAPCILPLLPVIVGGTIARGGDTEADQQKQWYRPLIITGSLALSVIIFGLLLKFSTSLLGVPQMTWQVISAVIVILFGINFLKPDVWEKLPGVNRLNLGSNKLLGESYSRKDIRGDMLIGLSLGPVFSSCSPTYALIVASVLPASFLAGLLYLVIYALGLAGTLLLIAYAGQSVVTKLHWLSNPQGWFRKTIGILFIVVGLMVLFGLDKKIQSYVLEKGWYDPISRIEQRLEKR
ncbi:sulfite exporter TauE/SafE family protein [Candidatus Saccharibacteria bacterium]|nr:sulfite exporter TauE/SafE family protein [Candidatus Saccharibacteria bacterium]